MNVITVLTYYLLVIQTVPARGFMKESCGKSLVNKTTKRRKTEWEAEDGEFPFVASLKVFRNGDYFHCLGALITKEFVLTSAGCIDGMSVDRSIIEVGMLDRLGNSKYTHEAKAQLFIVHKLYFQFWQHDIGLVKLSKPVNLKKSKGRIGIVCTPKKPYRPFKKVTVIGWGNPNNDSKNPILRAAVVLKKDSQECEKWSPMFNNYTFCTESSGTKKCMTDPGIPAVIKTKKRGMVLVGVTSYIFKCGDQPAYYTNVMEYMNWIKNKIFLHRSRRRGG